MIVPAKLLSIEIKAIEPQAIWNEINPDDPWNGYPYQWRVTFEVVPQMHSSPVTPTPYFYNGMDVRVGDWVADLITGSAVNIVSIVSQTLSTVVAICEDLDRYNTYTDPSGSGNGIGTLGLGFVFELADDGLPILSPMTALNTTLNTNLAWQLDLISRFRHRNMVGSYYRVQQNGHTFSVGDIIRLRTDGTYARVVPSETVDTAVGSVSSIGVPGVNWFTYRPVGRIVKNVTPPLPGPPGTLVYLDAIGDFTSNKPSAWAKPVYIRLDAPTTGIFLDRNVEGVGSLGYPSQTFVVPNIAARDALTSVNPGDQVMVEDDGNGEWIHFLRGVTNNWRLMVTEDASDTDAETFEVDIVFGTDRSQEIVSISSGSRVLAVTVEVIEPFSYTASLDVGTSGDPDLFMSNNLLDLTSIGTYTVNPATGQVASETAIRYTFLTGESTSGQCKISVSYT